MMKILIPKLTLIIFGLWLVFGLATQSGKFKPLPDYPDGYLPMDLEERVDFYLNDDVQIDGDIVTTGTLTISGARCDGQFLAYDASKDRFYWKSDS